MKKGMVISVGKTGGRKAEYFGFEGQACFDVSGELDRILANDFGVVAEQESVVEKDNSSEDEEKELIRN